MTLTRKVERSVADGVSAILAGDGEDAHRDGMFADALGRMFQELVADMPSWSRYWWIDDALPELVMQVDDRTVELAGIFIPGDDRSHQWIQPFQARLSIDPSAGRIVDYHVSLADDEVAIDAVSWGAKRPKHWPNVRRWAYAFDGPE
jgi:hypothetical protein